MSKSRSQKQKPDVNLVNEEPILVTPIPEGTVPETLPFFEFIDQDINSEKWDQSNTPNKEKISLLQEPLPITWFEDPQKVTLPPEIHAYQWKRCRDIFENVHFVVFAPQLTEYPDLISPNGHLLKVSFYRDFIATVENLLYIGSNAPFATEGSGTTGFHASGERAWRPWHHIYSCGKITKGEHTPTYNSSGKYIVRLYSMGCWRKIYVDDLLPLDDSEKILLPSLKLFSKTGALDIPHGKSTPSKKQNSSAKNDTFQLWPLLLCKALLKLASLHLCEGKYRDFDVLHCLTGWVPQQIPMKDVACDDLWDILLALASRFEWKTVKDGSTKKSGSSKTEKKSKNSTGNDKKGRKGAKTAIPSGIENLPSGNRYLMLTCENSQKNFIDDDKTTKNFTTLKYLSQVRDIPLNPVTSRPELELWKTFRYEEWAVERGLIPPDIKKLNIRSLKIVNPFANIQDRNSESEEQKFGMDESDQKSEKSSKFSKKSAKGKNGRLEPDPSMWIDFMEIRTEIVRVTVYFQSKCFKSKTNVSDLNFINKSGDFDYVCAPFEFKESKNESIYMFMDSIDYKFVLINLAQLGNAAMLDIECETVEEEIVDEMAENKDLDICDEIVLWKTRKMKEKSSDSFLSKSIERSSILMENAHFHTITFVMEEYSWESNSIGNSKVVLRSWGTKSMLIDLPPGRASFRLWISSSCPYLLQIFSDTKTTIGCLEKYLTNSGQESEMLTNLSHEIASCFGKLVQSFGAATYPLTKRNFYHTYKPFQNLDKQQLVLVHTIFYNEMQKMIAENSSIAAVAHVNLLFLQLRTFDYMNPYVEESHLLPDKFPYKEQIDYAKKMQRAAVKIQAFFKGLYIRKLMKKTRETHKEYYAIFDNLKKIYYNIFSVEHRLVFCPMLIRRFFERDEIIEKVAHKFEIFNDIKSVLNLTIFTGTHVVQENNAWVPICRYEFFVKSANPLKIKINLFCNLKHYYVRVFDNESQQEVGRIVNDVIVEKYASNTTGYTILAYGWSAKHIQKVNWKLILANQKTSKNYLTVLPNVNGLPSVMTLKGHYIPNHSNVICRYIMKVLSNDILTVNLTTSFDSAKISLKLMKNGKKICEIVGEKSVILAIVKLKTERNEPDELIKTNDKLSAVIRKRLSDPSDSSQLRFNKLSNKYLLSSDMLSNSRKKESNSSFGIDTDFKKRKRKNVDQSHFDLKSFDSISYISRRSDGGCLCHQSLHKLVRNFLGSLSKLNIKKKYSLQASHQESIRFKNKKSNQKLVPTQAYTEYILEATVVNNSWPLTAEEWAYVQKQKEKNYLNLLDESNFTRHLSKERKSITSVLREEPFWTLDLIYNSSKSMDLVADESESEKRKGLKSQWFNDIERYKRAMGLRQSFLEEHLISKSNYTIESDKRSNDPKDFSTKILQEAPLDQYIITPLENVDEDFCKIKSEDDYVTDEVNLERIMQEYKEEECVIYEEIKARLKEQEDNADLTFHWFKEIKQESVEMINDVLNLKKKYVEKLMSGQPSKKNTKGKTKKMNKKKKK
ncbi:hypothetical protein ABEB36_004881 [Hypothenemus hampei]|uniref:Androglobin n=1 Tax=Hypothenemus hampei TaxID=57062 RepID=A0ABD1EW94_HYPHA